MGEDESNPTVVTDQKAPPSKVEKVSAVLDNILKWFGVIGGIGAAVVAVLALVAADQLRDWLERRGLDSTETIVVGRVVDTRGNGVPGMRVLLYDQDTPVMERDKYTPPLVLTDSTGYFEFNDVEAGRYRVLPEWNGYRMGATGFAVADGQAEEVLRDVILAEDFVFPHNQAPEQGAYTIDNVYPPLFTEIPTPAFADPPGPVALGPSPTANATPGALTSPVATLSESALWLSYSATLDQENGRPGEPAVNFGSFFYRVMVEVKGSEVQLANIQSVELVLPPDSFWPNRVFLYPTTGLHAQFMTGVQFTLHARVHFVDGTSKDLELFVATGNMRPRRSGFVPIDATTTP